MTDDTDLSKARLFCADNLGVYIPQCFAKQVDRRFVTGVSDEDFAILEAGPTHENYWDAWSDVLDNAELTVPGQGKCYLHQDGDLWIVPVEEENIETGD